MYALVNPSKLTCSLKDDTKHTILTCNEKIHSNECVSNFWEKSPPPPKKKKLLLSYYLFTSVKTAGEIAGSKYKTFRCFVPLRNGAV